MEKNFQILNNWYRLSIYNKREDKCWIISYLRICLEVQNNKTKFKANKLGTII